MAIGWGDDSSASASSSQPQSSANDSYLPKNTRIFGASMRAGANVPDGIQSTTKGLAQYLDNDDDCTEDDSLDDETSGGQVLQEVLAVVSTKQWWYEKYRVSGSKC